MTIVAKRRAVSLTAVLFGLLVVSTGIAAARDFRPARPYDLRAGIHEEGLYIMRIPGTYGHLFPVPGLYPKVGGGGVESQSIGPQAGLSCPISIDGVKVSRPMPPAGIAVGGPKSMGESATGTGSILAPTGHAGSRADGLDASLRDAIRRLRSK